jgi:hypothetical protein
MQRIRRPSPSIIVAGVAVFIATTGGALAAIANNSILSKHIKDGEVRRADIRAGAVDSARVADGSVSVADLAPATRAALKPMWAVVTATGTKARSSAGVTAAYSGASFYTVTFPVSVTNCAYSGTIGATGTNYAGHGEVSVYSSPLGPKAVTVVTHDSAGAFSDRPFHLVVVC